MAKRVYYTDCPRCGDHSFEVLNRYGHCCGCLYFEDYYEDSESCYAAVRSLESSHMNPTLNNQQDDFEEDEEEIELAA